MLCTTPASTVTLTRSDLTATLTTLETTVRLTHAKSRAYSCTNSSTRQRS